MSKLHLTKMRDQLIDNGALFTVPDGGLYFCLDHQRFLHNKPEMRRHMNVSVHQRKGFTQCPDCLNYFPSKKELSSKQSRAGGNHTLPYSIRYVRIVNGKICGGEEHEEPAGVADEEGGAQDINEEADVDVGGDLQKILSVGSLSPCIQGLIPQVGVFFGN